MPNEMTLIEVAENLEDLAKAIEISSGGFFNSLPKIKQGLIGSIRVAASYLRQIAAGEYKRVVHARWKLVSEGARCNLVKCTHCGRSIAVTKNVPLDKWRAAKPYCDQCGALMGKDDIHE